MSRSLVCRGCWEQFRLPIFIRTPLAIPFRMFGLRPSRMNPNLCSLCETMFGKVMGKSQMVLTTTILFADIRGYTGFSQLLESPQLGQLLGRFYEECGAAIWRRDGIVNKLIGDAIFAIFNFPLRRADHVERAVEAGVDLQRNCLAMKRSLPPELERNEWLGVGVGIHTGEVSLGEFGQFCRDFTAVGPVVNLASRVQAAARAGEVVLTEEVYARVRERYPGAETRVCQLKGIEKPVPVRVVLAATAPD
ncbi:MAG: adenylate/guanylate cyclase domain-containing protein [Planctomycetales bacterium]|nr:adenylate/guanylate cyclase domain-containing protein [Planctomycetales bacterium]